MRIKEYYGDNNTKILGLWKDSENNENLVSLKQKWGDHIFSEEEIEHLLEGGSITFDYKYGPLTGHLQYYNYEGKKYFGFRPQKSKDYISNSVFDATVASSFEIDRRNEAKVNQFMRLYYYSKLLNNDGTSVKIDYCQDIKRQKQGADLIISKNGETLIVDEKAQIDYIYESRPTFVLELMNTSSGKEGWFVNEKLDTTHYMFIWPHADKKYDDKQLRAPEDIEFVDYALVDKRTLKDIIKTKYGLFTTILLEYVRRITNKQLDNSYEQEGRIYCKEKPFDNNVYLVYTKTKPEKPVNLVVKKTYLESIALEYGRLIRKKTNLEDISNG